MTSRLSSEHRILVRRREEDTRSKYQGAVKDDYVGRLHANWENKTTAKITRLQVQRVHAKLRERRAMELEARRDQLADLLRSEHLMYESELAHMGETPEERRERMINRAQELRAERESTRAAFAEAQLERVWRQQNDDLRLAQSRTRTLQVAADRLQQIDEKRAIEDEQAADEEVFDAMWEAERQKKVAREEAEKEARLEADHKMRQYLDQQMEAVRERKAEADRLEAEERALMAEQWALEERQEAADRVARQEAKRRMARELNYYNDLQKREAEERARKEREADLALLEQVLQRERQAVASENEHQRRLYAEADSYRLWLRELRRQEAAEEAHVERLRARESEREWQKRMAVWEREKAEREALMREVVNERRRQIQEKLEINRAARNAVVQERERLVREMEILAEMDRVEAEERMRERLDMQRVVRAQMDQRDWEKQMEQEAKLRERLEAEERQRRETERLNSELATLALQSQKAMGTIRTRTSTRPW